MKHLNTLKSCIVLAATLVIAVSGQANAKSATSIETPAVSTTSAPASEWMTEGKRLRTPSGYHDFCKREPEYCAKSFNESVRLDGEQRGAPYQMNQSRWNQLVAVNDKINTTVRGMSDIKLNGVADYWQMPTTAGDCEDTVLAKRAELIALGWPEESLLITIAKGKISPYHAVLIARTSNGDYVLNNMEKKVLPIKDAGYDWVVRQSSTNPTQWKFIASATVAPQTQTASAQ